MSRVVVEMRRATKFFGQVKALDAVDLVVREGEVVVLVGPSGSGKSTLCRSVNGLEALDGGSVILNGKPLPVEGKALAQARTKLGMVFQSFNLFAHKNVLDNVTLAPVKNLGMSKAQAQEKALQLLGKFGVAEQRHLAPAQLSGGQQQRVAIARALAMDPAVLLFDEPTSALDPENVREVLNCIEQCSRDGMTMLVVTHEMRFAKRIADRVIFMSEGRVVEQGRPEEFFTNPSSPELKRFLSELLVD